MKGEKEESSERTHPVMLALPAPPSSTDRVLVPPMELETAETVTFGSSASKDNEGETEELLKANGIGKTAETPVEVSTSPVTQTDRQVIESTPESDPAVEGTQSTSKPGDEEELPYETKGFDWGKYILSLFARNFYNFKYVALVLAFVINVMLLFYKVTRMPVEGAEDGSDDTNGTDTHEEEFNEIVVMESDIYFREYMMQILAVFHSLVSFSMLIAYYCLKVPLVIFKREKEIARKLEFEGLWVADQPGDDDIKAHWDKLVLSTQSFPESYWDKFVKKKVRARYAEQYDYEAISNLLGMDKGDSIKLDEEQKSRILPSFLSNVDWQYQIWKWGVIFTDNSFLYIAWYFIFSILGNNNYFFFAAHLLDVAIAIPALRTILQSVTHNGKQLVLTVMLTSVIVYIYTVVAFNFFRKFYVKEDNGNVDYKCHDMLTCFVYHLHTGVRAGGGIGDEIEPADGDAYEVYRILFDITFFFFVIVILLAIIQGLIIDAFGELRDQLEQVKEDMESKCFICGIGKEYFDKVPHGFETHVTNEHNFANYMFFIMHLINKPDTEYTGQETYVWELYQQRVWDFFPVGDCFRKQYEDEASN